MEDQPQLDENPEVELEGKSKPLRRESKLRRMSPWKLAAIICSLLMIVLITMVGIFVAILMKNSAFQGAMKNYQVMIQCEDQLAEIGAALERYATSTDRFPEKLEDLYPDYLGTRKVFRCPADRRKGAQEQSGYFYAPPKAGASDDTVVIVCRRHRVFASQPPFIVELHKNGDVTHAPVVETRGRGSEARGRKAPR